MSEDRMQGIQRLSVGALGAFESDDGRYVLYEDAIRVLQKLRDALEEAKEYIENLQLPDKEWSRILDLVVAALREAK